MSIVENRYLNLLGGAWSPQNPSRPFSITNAVTGGLSCLAVLGAINLNTKVKDNPLFYTLISGAVAIYTLRNIAKEHHKEALYLSDDYKTLVIDTKPDKSTPPTSPDIIMNAEDLFDDIKSGGWLYETRTLKWAFTDAALATVSLGLMAHFDNGYIAVGLPYFAMNATDVFNRYVQFSKIANQDWKIVDMGDAQKNYDDGVKKSQPNLRLAPSHREQLAVQKLQLRQ